MERQKASPLSPRRPKYEVLPPGSPNPKSRLRSTLNKHLSPRSREQVAKVRLQQAQHAWILLHGMLQQACRVGRRGCPGRKSQLYPSQVVFVGAFLLVLGALLYALHSMTAERVCVPNWASHPPGSHLKIAIVTMTDSQLQSRKAHKQVMTTAHSDVELG